MTGCPCGSTELPEGSRSSASSPVIAGSMLLRQVYASARSQSMTQEARPSPNDLEVEPDLLVRSPRFLDRVRQ
jgi:hypothetical protein